VEDAKTTPRRIVFCSGKVAHDLADYRDRLGIEDVVLARLEQLYPFPKDRVEELIQEFPDAELVWCQEEPRNMGPWASMLQRFRDLHWKIHFVGRAAAASPATGSYTRHHAEQSALVAAAFADLQD
ncbi:MAG: 2-oxoglutarate dehydrogenase E1 component, partial [Planctomycetota bacterium]|jgi:2-oxoglutarate dehydrogenase E1 component